MTLPNRIRNADRAKVLGKDTLKKGEQNVQQLTEAYTLLHSKVSELRKQGLDVFFADSKLKMVKPKIDYYKASLEDKDFKKVMSALVEVKDEIRETIKMKVEQAKLKKKLAESENNQNPA